MLLVLVCQTGCAQDGWKTVTNNIAASFRGLSVVDDKVAWVSGSQGWVGHTSNGGADWTFRQVDGFEKVDFRSLYAFDGQRAIVANAGAPASILITADAGSTWKEVYRNEQKEAFFDGMDFWNEKEGVAYGDPIGGRMLLVRTEDGGQTWKDFPDGSRPLLNEGEASFAASGTGIRCVGQQTLIIATGGKTSRLWKSADKGKSWITFTAPIVQGKASTGIFSVACLNEQNWIIVGGDFENDSLTTHHVFYTRDGGRSWLAPKKPTRGYREGVEFADSKTAVAVGPKGSEISGDGGVNWLPLADAEGIHVVRKARKGKLQVMAGGKGRLKVAKR